MFSKPKYRVLNDAAWVVSLTQVEEGRDNSNQWTLNRIGALQIAVLSSQSISNSQQHVRVYCY